MIKFIVRLFKSLNTNSHPGEIAHAVSCAFLLGLMPKNNLLWYIVFVFCCFLRINKAAYGIWVLVFSMFAPLLDNLLDIVGYAILTFPPFEKFFSWLLDVPFVAFTSFNNSIVMGSLVVGLLLYFPIYGISRLVIKYWRKFFSAKLRNVKAIAYLGKIPLVKKIHDVATAMEELK